MNVGIFATTYERAYELYEMITDNIDAREVSYMTTHPFDLVCKLNDGTVIRSLVLSDECRGMYFDEIYCDEDITEEMVLSIVRLSGGNKRKKRRKKRRGSSV